MLTTNGAHLSRRIFRTRSGAASIGLASAAGLGLLPRRLCAAEAPADVPALVRGIKDAEILAGMEAAIAKNIMSAAVELHFVGVSKRHCSLSIVSGRFQQSTGLRIATFFFGRHASRSVRS